MKGYISSEEGAGYKRKDTHNVDVLVSTIKVL